MSILTAEKIGLSFGAFDLFKGITCSVANDSKIGLIGLNGVGKTSLLLILAGINLPTTGQIHLARGKRLGYLRQEAVDAFADCTHTVYEEMLGVFGDLRDQQSSLNALEARMAEGASDVDALLEEYGRRQEAFEKAGGYDYELRIQQTLSGLGLGKEDWPTPLNHLSGGQKTRALLARLLLEKPDLLMLDEPTNHLDVDAVEWLERTLAEWDGAVLIVSHDRYFLDHAVNTIWEMTPTGIETYPGGYSAYLQQRQERWQYAERVFKEEKERLLKEIDFVQRNWVRATTHARALGLLRRITRDLAVVDAYGILALRSGQKWSEFDLHADRPLDVIEAIRKINALSMRGSRPPAIRPRLEGENLLGSTIVARTHHLVVGYPGHELFRAPDLILRRGECAALIGPNGSGKTTFLKTLLGQVEPLEGSTQPGPGMKTGYFAQAHDTLRPDRTVLEELTAQRSISDHQARAYLAQYLFRGEDVYKPVAMLSGGERARLALAILAQQGANFLVLDEPTNHLDIPAREALQEVLEAYRGTILLVSHDRYLIDRLATQIWELRDGRLTVFEGRYRDYVLRKSTETGAAKDRKVLLLPKPLTHDNSKETRRRMETLAQIEERIHAQENAIQHLSTQLQKAGEKQAHEHARQLSWQMAREQAALDSLMAEWESLAG